MARIRSVKPELCTVESFMDVSRDARLTFVLTQPFCDDGGVHPASLKVIKAEIFPADDDATTGKVAIWLDELLLAGLLGRYRVGDQHYIFVRHWKGLQRIEKPQPLKYPQPGSEGAEPVLELFGGHALPDHSGTTAEPCSELIGSGISLLPDHSGTTAEPLLGEGKEGGELGGDRRGDSEPKGSAAIAAQLNADPVKSLFDTGVRILTGGGQKPTAARSIIGQLRKAKGDEGAAQVLVGAARATDPTAYVQAAIRHSQPDIKPRPQAKDWNIPTFFDTPIPVKAG